MDDRKFLNQALALAETALAKGSNPIGVVIVDAAGEVIADGYNQIKLVHDVTAHGEVVAMRQAGKWIMKKHAPEITTLYTTLEPCFACGFFITRSNIGRVVWALNDPYKGGIEFLKETHKLAEDFRNIDLVEEPFEDVKAKSAQFMAKYYFEKGDAETARLFRNSL